jgi:hypothetical protein
MVLLTLNNICLLIKSSQLCPSPIPSWCVRIYFNCESVLQHSGRPTFSQPLANEESLCQTSSIETVQQRCYYCWTKSGYSVNFTSLDQYGKHVIYNHEGYSIYVFDEDVKRYKKELKALRRKQMIYPKQFRQP